ncbi:hypothetical protein Pm34_28 [Proteus phage vB_PvuS_Pm34]|nr:hypothetical protein Pm34_28 [Proteus phage vB_PvuS_Pm34]
MQAKPMSDGVSPSSNNNAVDH